PLSVFSLRYAHPLSDTSNARELNPHLTGVRSGDCCSKRFFVPVAVGLGELGLDGTVSFDYSHNFFRFFVCQHKLNRPTFLPEGEMFFPVELLELPSYRGPQSLDTDSDLVSNVVCCPS